MDNKKTLMVEALALVILQIFLLFLPTTRIDDESFYHSSTESYSAVQMITDFSDTIHDPSVKNMKNKDDLEIVNSSRITNFFMVSAMLLAISCTVSSFAVDNAREALLCIASLMLGSVPLFEASFLNKLCGDSEKMVSRITFLGVLQILFAVIVIILVVIARKAESSSDSKMEREIIENLKKRDSERTDYLKEPAWKRVQQEKN